jgi:hypothetical protein
MLPDSIPRDSVPRDTIPRDSVPGDSVPGDSVPRDSIPPDTAPGAVASIAVHPDSQQVAVGDSGAVAATLRDSAGREVRDDAGVTQWVVSDSTVVRITNVGVGWRYVIFRAQRSGRAAVIARYRALADTAVVLVG